jgi:FkbM family methyltransferase
MRISLIDTLTHYQIPARGIIHVGAHVCEEMPIYLKAGAQKDKILWFEANPSVVERTKKRDPEIDVYSYAVSDVTDQTVSFNITNNFQSSSILQLKKHKTHYPNIKVTSIINVSTIRMDDFFERYNYDPANYNILNMDVQGAELKVLIGFDSLLKNFDLIYTEINVAELYDGCCTVNDLDKYLSTYNFIRIKTFMTPKEWGEAIYIKRNIANKK